MYGGARKLAPFTCEELSMADNFPTYDRVHSLLRYDRNSGELFWRVRMSNRVKAGHKAGSVNKSGYVQIGFDGHRFWAHRLVFFMQTGSWPTEEIDHIDGNKLNNAWSNLRECSRQENAQNRKNVPSTNALGVLGVRRVGNRFRSAIEVDGKSIHLGYFSSAEEASAAYLSAKSDMHHGYVN